MNQNFLQSGLTSLGHQKKDMAGLINEMLEAGKYSRAEIVAALMKQHGRDERLAEQKLVSHISHLNRGENVRKAHGGRRVRVIENNGVLSLVGVDEAEKAAVTKEDKEAVKDTFLIERSRNAILYGPTG